MGDEANDRSVALRSAIAADAGDRAAWLVYADWLMDRGDPRGQLVAAYARGDYGAVRALLDAHEGRFYGRFATDLRRFAEISWRHGFWHLAKVPREPVDLRTLPPDIDGLEGLVQAVLSHPSAALLAAIHVHGIRSPSTQHAIIEILSTRPSLQSLLLHASPPRRLFAREEVQGIASLEALWGSLPRLEALDVCGRVFLGEIDAPELATLTVDSERSPHDLIGSLCRGRLPALEHLTLRLRRPEPADLVEAAAPLLRCRSLPRLAWLELQLRPCSDQILPLLLASPLLPALSHLRLGLDLTDAGLRTLLAGADRLAHLDQLAILNGDGAAETADRLAMALPDTDLYHPAMTGAQWYRKRLRS